MLPSQECCLGEKKREQKFAIKYCCENKNKNLDVLSILTFFYFVIGKLL